MAAIHIPRRRLVQPRGRTEINFNNSLCVGLEVAMTGSSPGAWVRGGVVNPTISGAKQVEKNGVIGWGFNAYGTSGSDAITIPVHDFAASSVTSFAFSMFDGPVNGRLWDGGSIYAQCGADAGRNTTGSLQYANPPSTTYGENSMSTVALPPAGTAGANFYRNVSAGSEGSSGSGASLAISSLVIGNRAALDRCLSGVIFMTAHWSRLLGAAEVYDLHTAPWQLFRADPVRFYSLPSGAITLNSLTASNITSSSARFTVGLTR